MGIGSFIGGGAGGYGGYNAPQPMGGKGAGAPNQIPEGAQVTQNGQNISADAPVTAPNYPQPLAGKGGMPPGLMGQMPFGLQNQLPPGLASNMPPQLAQMLLQRSTSPYASRFMQNAPQMPNIPGQYQPLERGMNLAERAQNFPRVSYTPPQFSPALSQFAEPIPPVQTVQPATTSPEATTGIAALPKWTPEQKAAIKEAKQQGTIGVKEAKATGDKAAVQAAKLERRDLIRTAKGK